MPPGLGDLSARRHVLAALGRHREQLRRDGLSTPAGLSLFENWLRAADERDGVTRRKILAAARSRRYRARKAAERARQRDRGAA